MEPDFRHSLLRLFAALFAALLEIAPHAFAQGFPDQQPLGAPKTTAAAPAGSLIVEALNADLRTSAQDFKDAYNASVAAAAALGPSSSRTDVNAKAAEIKQAK